MNAFKINFLEIAFYWTVLNFLNLKGLRRSYLPKPITSVRYFYLFITALSVVLVGYSQPANQCWKVISAGGRFTVAIKADGTLWAWGENAFGQLGLGITNNTAVPKQVGKENNWQTIVAAFGHTVALKNDGTLWAWGRNGSGQLGDGTNVNRNIPIQVGTANDWASISARGFHTVAVKTDGTLWAWGSNSNGQLGDGTNWDKKIPTQIGTDIDWAIVSAHSHTLAIKTNGTLWAWGHNLYGQLGDGTTANQNTPIQIGTEKNWAIVSAGQFYSWAIKKDGTLWSWGINNNGQIGAGVSLETHIPTQVGSDAWKAIIAGVGSSTWNDHTLGIRSDNTLWGCGYNLFGQVGDGTTVNKKVLTRIDTDTGFVAVTAGSDHTMAIRKDGSLWGWGSNVGALGNGSINGYSVPTQVINPCVPCPAATTRITNLSSCKALVYSGNTYTANTILKDTIKSGVGCDSIYNVVNINISPATTTTHTNNLTSCKSVVYNSNTYSTSAVIRDTIKNTQGCDSIYNVASIKILPITPVTNNVNLSSCKSIVYKGNTYTSSAFLRDTVVSVNGGCDSIYNITNLIIKPIIPVNQDKSLRGCAEVIYNGNTYTASTMVRDTLRSITGCDSVYNTINITISPIKPVHQASSYSNCDSVVFNGIVYRHSTTIIDTIRTDRGCDSIFKQTTIKIFDKPSIKFIHSQMNVPANEPFRLQPVTTLAKVFKWEPGIYLDHDNVQSPVCTPVKDTVYKLKVVGDNGCADSAYLAVIVFKTINVPTAFSPNGDGVNDKWEIKLLDSYPKNKVQIFDRWGRLLCENLGNFRSWDGKYKGRDVPVGVYYYIIRLGPSLSSYNGSVTVLR
jgi:gliding motility-associated-like protein